MPFGAAVPSCAYYAIVSRMEKRPATDFWPIQLRTALPVIRIPLHEPDPAVGLDLQAALHHVYDAARYGNYIYEETPQPALSAEESAWARSLIGKQ
jgi:Protein of unknown function (DUF4058)